MYRIHCPICTKSFSRKDVMLRHLRNIHPQNRMSGTDRPPGRLERSISPTSMSSPPSSSKSSLQIGGMRTHRNDDFKFQHPFTMMVSGPTSCGKTYFLKQMLQDIRQVCEPYPQRIVWLYKRWQPLYDVIRRTVNPHVEFVHGIPPDLEHDSFFDPQIRNLIVLDDLMSMTAKDSRINDLFTEGSHHRNLSVIVLNQNLYFSKDPT